jgi:Fic family protein
MLFKSPKLTEEELRVVREIYDMRKALRYNLASARRWTGLLRRNTFARAVRGSNSIEGYNVTAEDAIAAVEGEEPLQAERDTWLAVTGYRNAMTFVLQLALDKGFTYNDGFVRSMHFMMVQHDLSKHPGNWRPGAVYVRDEARNQVVYEGPDVESLPSLLRELFEYLNGDEDAEQVLIRAAMAHLNFVMIHPFSDGNGRMARCLQTLVLAREGILEPQFCSVEEYLGRNTQDYYNVLAEVGQGSWHPRNDARPWIRFNLTAHFRQAATLLKRTRVADRLWDELEEVIRRHGLPSRVIYAVADGAVGYRVRNASYRHLAEVNDITASRDLKAAVDAGLLIPEGERRGRGYVGSGQMKEIYQRIRSEEIQGPIANPFIPQSGMLEFHEAQRTS